MSIIPSNLTTVYFNNNFLDSEKNQVCNNIFNKIKKENITILKDLTYNYSAEGGLELPKTNEWVNLLDNHPDKNKRILHKYQSTRQLRFINKNNYIIGATCKDSINHFTDDELNEIIDIINNL